MTSTIQKVTGYVTRRSACGKPELLVFQPPNVGLQVPAGTVEPGESFDAAVVRELSEETGLTALRKVRYLGCNVVPLTDHSRALLQDVVLLRGPGLKEDTGFHLARAYWLGVTQRLGSYAEVLVEAHNNNVDPPQLLKRFSGWVHADLLAEQMERRFYHFEVAAPTLERWPIEEGGQWYECYWVPLVPRPVLDHELGAWNDEYYEKVLEGVGARE